MSFGELWHLATTSRYTRLIERENALLRRQLEELRKENHALIFALSRRRELPPESEEPSAAQIMRQGSLRRRGAFPSFSQAKKQLESLEAPTTRSAI
jgi:hypothetical protein